MKHRRPSLALAVAVLALVMAMGGTSFAAKLITGKNIKNESVTGADLKNRTVTGADLKDGSVTSGDVKNGSLTAADLKAGTTVDKAIARKRVVATAAGTEAAARLAAPQVVLFSKGALTVYAKCFTDTSGPTTYSEVFIKTSQNGAIFDSRQDSLDGGPAVTDFLNTDTIEGDRELETDSTGANNASMDSEDDSDFTAFAPDGTTLRGWTGAAVKNGTLPGGNGVYGDGDACLFTGIVFAG